MSLGELVTATKIITRPEEENISSQTAESTCGDFSLTGNNDLWNILPVDSSSASKKLPQRPSDTAGNATKNGLIEKSVNDSINTLAEMDTQTVDTRSQADVVSKTEQEDIDGQGGQSPEWYGETSVTQEHHPETNETIKNTGVQCNHNNDTGTCITTSKEELTDSLKKGSNEREQPDVGKDTNTSRKKGRQKKKTSNTVLQEEFGGGESFQIFNTDMVMLERPGPSKAQSPLQPPPVIPEFKTIIPSKSDTGRPVHETVPRRPSPSLTNKQHVSSELPLPSSCSMDKDNSNPFPSKDVTTNSNSTLKIHERKKIVAVRRRKVGVAVNSYQKPENGCNSNCGNSYDEKKTPDKTCIIDERDQEASVQPEDVSASAGSLMANTQDATEDQITKPIGGDFTDHTYSKALEDYENFLQTWDETSNSADVGDLITLLVQKCRGLRNGKCNGISHEMVSKTLSEVKSSHVNDLNGLQRNLEKDSSDKLSQELRRLSVREDLPNSTTCGPTSSHGEQVPSSSKFTGDSEQFQNQDLRVGSEQQLKRKTASNIILDSLLKVSDSTTMAQNSVHPEAVESSIGTNLQQDPLDSRIHGAFVGSTAKPTQHKIVRDISDYAIKREIGQKQSTTFAEDKSASGNSSSSVSSHTSSSSMYDSDLESDCDSDCNESPGNYGRDYMNEASSCGDRYLSKNTSEDETEENLKCGGQDCSFRMYREYPRYKHHTQYLENNLRDVPHGNPELFHYHAMPPWYHNQLYYPCAATHSPHWRYPPWYAYYPNPYPYHYHYPVLYPNPYYPQCHKQPRTVAMNNFLTGAFGETDSNKMKKILKCQFDYLKYMKKP